MRARRALAISRLAGVMTAAWLCGTGSAWAGDGGDDAGAIQSFLSTVCDLVNVPSASCPQVPTLTQGVLAIANFQNTPPDFVRGPQGPLLGGFCAVSPNSSGLPTCSETNAVTTVNPLAPSSIALSDLPNLTPLAFITPTTNPYCPPTSPGQATPVPLGTNCANSFVYPALTGTDGQHTLNVVFDYTPWTSKSFVKGQKVGSFTFPLVILNGATETPVVAKLQLTATCGGAVSAAQACLAGTVTGIGANPLSAAQLGIQFGFQLAASPNSSTPHAIITFRLPVIVAQATDPVYFGLNNSATPPFTFINQLSGQATAFSREDLGFTPNSLGVPIGVAPTPAPLCSPSSDCPPSTIHFGFCAMIADTPAAATLTPAAGTFISFGTDGTAYASSPIALQVPPQCP